MKKLLIGLIALIPASLMSMLATYRSQLKKAVPTGVSPSRSQRILQQLKQLIQRKTPYEDIQRLLQEYKQVLNPTSKKVWEHQSVRSLPHMATQKERGVANFENSLKQRASYDKLEELLQIIENAR